MKKIILIFLIFSNIFIYNAKAQSMPWTAIESLDEFGDPTGEYGLGYQTTNATFSNNIVADKPLTVFIGFSKKWGVVIQFKEYGKYYASLYTGINQNMRIKTSSGKTMSFLMIPRSKGRIFPLNTETNKDDFLKFIQLLKDENYIKCVFMDSNHQQYNFKIDCKGFTRAYTTFLTKNGIDKVNLLNADIVYKIGD